MSKNNHFILFIAAVCTLTFLFPQHLLSGENRMNAQQVLDIGPEWKNQYLSYRVDESFIDTLKAECDESVSFEVYFGTWCKDSKILVPQFIKFMEIGINRSRKTVYIGVSPKQKPDIKYYIEKIKIDHLPTIIVSRSGEEIGRIVERPKKSIVEDLIDIL